MSFIGVKSARSFRQFRVAVFGVTAFLRLAWAFTLALNAFSLTTLAESSHQIISTVMFAINAAAFMFIVVVGTFEAFRFKIASWTSRVAFELVWILVFWILEIAGATTFTILSPSFQCGVIVSLNENTGSTLFSIEAQRPTSSTEATTCQLFNRIALFGSWAAVGFTSIYAMYLLLLCLMASRRSPLVWRSQINHFDWAITSLPICPRSPDLIRPEMIQRPGNPHLSKDYNDSMDSLPPVFIDPFQIKKDSFDSATWHPEAMETIHYPLDRHSVMAQYQPRPIHPNQWQMAESMAQTQHRPTQSQSSALGLEGMEGPPIDHRKSRPTLSIYVPPPPAKAAVPIGAAEEDYDRIGRTMSVAMLSPQTYDSHAASEEPCVAIGRRMSMPFASPVGSDESASFPLALGKSLAESGYTKSQTTTSTTDGHGTVQNVRAKVDYPTVQKSVNRKSTMVRADSLTVRRSMRFGPEGPYRAQARTSQGSSGGILPLHVQDLSTVTPQPHGGRQQVHVMHNRSYSAAATFPTAYAPHAMPLAPARTWPAHSAHRPTHPGPVYRSSTTQFPVHFPPPPNHSPASTAPSFSHSSYRNGTQGHGSHSRSSSTPSSYQQHPIPALLDALSPVVRNSGNFQGARVLSSQHQSWRGSGITHPFLDDNPFGGRSASRTPEGSIISSSDSKHSYSPTNDEKKQRPVSKLRKSMHRDI